jgi:glycerate dehydrogenase
MRGVFLDVDTIDRGDLELGSLFATLPEWTPYPGSAAAEVSRRIRDIDVVVSNKVLLDRKTLLAAKHLKLVCIAATGTNNIDLETAGARNISVCNVTGYATPSVVEHVFAQILILNRQLYAYRDAVTRGRWQQADGFCLLDFPIRELNGLILGIIGYGELGRAVARMGEAFGMQILVAERAGATPRPGRIPLKTLLAESHVVSLHCPLTDATRNLIGAAELGLMRRDAVLINTARGGMVDEDALLHALQTGRIAGAAMDVLSEEPPRHGNPLLEAALPNLVITPHIAWASINARQRLIDEITRNIQAWLAGSARNLVCS